MSNVISWIAAVAESGEGPDPVPFREGGPSQDSANEAPDQPSLEDLPAHQFPSLSPEQGAAPTLPEEFDVTEELCELERRQRVYRGRTAAMLRKYMRYSLETGRLPSLVGREFFRSKVTKYSVTTFEDRVIFVHDMENCVRRLDELSQQVLARVVLQEYEREEAARLLGCNRKTLYLWLIEALNKLSEVLIEVGLLEIIPPGADNSCQGGPEDNFCASDEEQRK